MAMKALTRPIQQHATTRWALQRTRAHVLVGSVGAKLGEGHHCYQQYRQQQQPSFVSTSPFSFLPSLSFYSGVSSLSTTQTATADSPSGTYYLSVASIPSADWKFKFNAVVEELPVHAFHFVEKTRLHERQTEYWKDIFSESIVLINAAAKARLERICDKLLEKLILQGMRRWKPIMKRSLVQLHGIHEQWRQHQCKCEFSRSLQVIPKFTLFAEKSQWKSIFQYSLNRIAVAYKERNTLNDHDFDAIDDYTGDGYTIMNRALRLSDIPSPVQARISAVEKALIKLSAREEVVYQGTVLRGTSLPEHFLRTIVPGATFSDPAFMSTSTTPSVAENFHMMQPDGAILVAFVIYSKTGVDVEKLSCMEGEDEVLFRPNTQFRIQSVENNVVCMEELALVCHR